jgi:hypothetical protein
VILISNFVLTVSDGSTIASTEIYGIDKKTYVNIGSGNVFKLAWTTVEEADQYRIMIKRHDPVLNVYYDILDKAIGLVNEFYVDSSLLPALPLQYMLSIYVVAYGKQENIITTSNIVNPYVSKGTGTYVKATPVGYAQPIMKRSLVFVKAPVPTKLPVFTLDENGNEVELFDENDNEISIEATNILVNKDWNIAIESYVKDDSSAWHLSDIRYEVLVDKDGNIITDNTDKPIYTL